MDVFKIVFGGLVVGMSLAAPVGPMALLCINRTLTQGFLYGVLTGLGIALADALYGVIAALGVSSVSEFLVAYRVYFGVIGGFFLAWLGFKAVRAHALSQTRPIPRIGAVKSFWTAFALTLSNPATILAYVAIFSSSVVAINTSEASMVFVLVGSIFLGSLLWWLMLSGGVAATKHRLNEKHAHYLNLASGVMLIAFGVFATIAAFL